MRVQRVLEGSEVKRKIECQGCGQAKIEGELCDAEIPSNDKKSMVPCGWPQIEIQRSDDGGIFIFLPLCPSNNAKDKVARRGRFASLISTDAARDYIASVKKQLRPLIERAIAEWGWKPVTTWQLVWTWVVLPRTSCDPHNYWKVSLDALEAGGAFFDDRYAITRLGGIWFDTKNTGMVFKL